MASTSRAQLALLRSCESGPFFFCFFLSSVFFSCLSSGICQLCTISILIRLRFNACIEFHPDMPRDQQNNPQFMTLPKEFDSRYFLQTLRWILNSEQQVIVSAALNFVYFYLCTFQGEARLLLLNGLILTPTYFERFFLNWRWHDFLPVICSFRFMCLSFPFFNSHFVAYFPWLKIAAVSMLGNGITISWSSKFCSLIGMSLSAPGLFHYLVTNIAWSFVVSWCLTWLSFCFSVINFLKIITKSWPLRRLDQV